MAAIPIVAGFAPGAAVTNDDLVTGFHTVMRAAAAMAVVAGVVAWLSVRDRPAPPADTAIWHCAAGGPPVVVEPATATSSR